MNASLLSTPWNLKEQLLTSIHSQGGFVNCHGHFDKAFYITKETLGQANVSMQTKWRMSDDLKRSLSQADIEARIRRALDILIAQGCTLTCSFIDAYSAVEGKAIHAACAVQTEYADRITFLTVSHPLGGLVEKTERDWFEKASEQANIVGGLPSKDRPNEDQNWDTLFSIAQNLNKPLHIHVDQENNPAEHEMEQLIHYTRKYRYEGRVVAVHAISLAAQSQAYRQEIYEQMADAGISVVACPSAALSMQQLNHLHAPVHNSIANVPEMLATGITIGVGVDNIADFYQPFIDADMWVELRMLMESCRFYDFEQLVNIASINGRKILAIQ